MTKERGYEMFARISSGEMKMAAVWFLRFGVVFAVVGMALGIVMGASHDFLLMPVHAHINLVGWVSMFLAGLFYHTHPRAEGFWSRLHLLVAVPAMLIMVAGIYGAQTNAAWGVPVAIAGSLAVIIAMILFAGIVFAYSGKRDA
jgi:hypothetical protein